MAYLAGAYPGLYWREPSSIRLEAGWLVEAAAGSDGEGFEEPSNPWQSQDLRLDTEAVIGEQLEVRALVMVSPSGSVEELGASTLSRRSAHRGLTTLHAQLGDHLGS